VLVIGLMLLVCAGCSRPVVKQDQQQSGSPSPSPSVSFDRGYQQGTVHEQDLHAVQAELKVVYFNYDSYSLTPEAQESLQYNAQILHKAPQAAVVAEGHCDERGTAEYNLALGERRAQAVVEYLASLGIAQDRLSTVSYGSELPVDPGHNEAAWAKNRRVYLRVSR
jgi:peptidoglycan-associated lipoprotein